MGASLYNLKTNRTGTEEVVNLPMQRLLLRWRRRLMGRERLKDRGMIKFYRRHIKRQILLLILKAIMQKKVTETI